MSDNDKVGGHYDWMPESRQLAAQCWCDKETEHLVMIPELAEAIARRISAWMVTGAQHARNEEWWREQCESQQREIDRLRELLAHEMEESSRRNNSVATAEIIINSAG